MRLWAVGLGIPALFWLFAAPLVLGWNPPAHWLGFRRPRTAGYGLLAAGALAGLANLVLLLCFDDGPAAPVLAWILLQSAGWGILALVPVWWHLRRR